MTILFAIFRASNLVFVDESGLNRHYRRELARAKRGAKVYEKKPGKRLSKTNIIAGLCNGRHVAAQCYEHSTTASFFEDWFEWELCAAIPEGSIVVMDNASFHRKSKLPEIASRHGVYVLFLPPYSPEFNPIEKTWANLKHWLKNNLARFPSVQLAVMFYFDVCRC